MPRDKKENNDFRDVTVAMISLNEEKAVGKVIREIKKNVPKAEILIVDSSKDKTPQIAKKLGARVIRQFPPRGYGKAMDKALRNAKGEIVITMDCDATYPSELIPKVTQLIRNGYDLVNCSRTSKRPKNMPFFNYIANRLFALLTTMVHGIKTTDIHSGMRGYRRSMIEKLSFDLGQHALPVELLIKPVIHGYKFKEINIPYKERLGNTTLRRLNGTWWTIKRIVNLKLKKNKCASLKN